MKKRIKFKKKNSWMRTWKKKLGRNPDYKKMFVILECAVVVLLILVAVPQFYRRIANTAEPENYALRALKGTYVYDEYTEYDFDGRGNGCMRLEDVEFAFSYDIEGDQLRLDYESEKILDSVYTFQKERKSLTIIGGEGTTGGTYVLHRK